MSNYHIPVQTSVPATQSVVGHVTEISITDDMKKHIA